MAAQSKETEKDRQSREGSYSFMRLTKNSIIDGSTP